MKKIFMVFLSVVFLSVLLIGCSGSNGNKGSYTYKWGPAVGGFSTSSSSLGFMNENEGEEPPAPVYSGTVVPPYGSVRYGTNEIVMGVCIYTYWDGVPVKSNFSHNPDDGDMIVINDIDTFRPKKAGISQIIASYNGETLTIPIHTYYAYIFDGLTYLDFDTMTVYPTADSQADVLLGGTNYKAPFGYLIASNTAISQISSAPNGFYRELSFEQEYWAAFFDSIESGVSIIRTSEGKYVKLRFMYSGTLGTAFSFWISDENGVFSH